MTNSSDTSTELMDSLLHNNIKRVVLGGFCGFLAGCIMIFVTGLFPPEGAGHLWWLQLTASFCYGGAASAFNVSQGILVSGAIWHFSVSIFLGLVFGKMTKSGSLPRLLAYGLVLGGLCWLASNMFAPDFFNIYALGAVKQWCRMFFFQTFTLSLALLVSLGSGFVRN